MLSHFSSVWLCDPMACSPPGSSVHGILQARILEWGAMPSSEGTKPVSLTPPELAGRFFTTRAAWRLRPNRMKYRGKKQLRNFRRFKVKTNKQTLRLICLQNVQNWCQYSSNTLGIALPVVSPLLVAPSVSISALSLLKMPWFLCGAPGGFREADPHLSPRVSYCIWLTFDSGMEMWSKLV